MKHFLTPLLTLILMLANNPTSSAETASADGVIVDVKTTAGDMRLKLYDDTPLHRDNFVKLVNEGFYDGVLFHRVIKEFMIQTGDPDSKNAKPGQALGSGGPDYQIDAEILCPKHFHKRGALAAARTGDNVNPLRKSGGSQFYVVTGRKFSPAELDMMDQRLAAEAMQGIFNRLCVENRDTITALQAAGDNAGLEALRQQLIARTEAEAAANPVKLTPEQREAYTTVGGAPHLDGSYTVFGEVISGIETAEKIENAQTDSNDRPLEDVRIIKMTVVK